MWHMRSVRTGKLVFYVSLRVKMNNNSYFVCSIWEIKFTTFQRVQADEASQPQEHHRPAQLFHPTEVPGGIPRSLHCDGTYGCKPLPGLDQKILAQNILTTWCMARWSTWTWTMRGCPTSSTRCSVASNTSTSPALSIGGTILGQLRKNFGTILGQLGDNLGKI